MDNELDEKEPTSPGPVECEECKILREKIEEISNLFRAAQERAQQLGAELQNTQTALSETQVISRLLAGDRLTLQGQVRMLSEQNRNLHASVEQLQSRIADMAKSQAT